MQTRLIKRYANRKLYDTELSHYVTLGQVFDYIQNGDDVSIMCNVTKHNITTPILLNALVERGKGASNDLVVNDLNLIAFHPVSPLPPLPFVSVAPAVPLKLKSSLSPQLSYSSRRWHHP